MNFKSGKFRALILGKLFARSSGHVWPQEIGKVWNLSRYELSELKIDRVEALPIGGSECYSSHVQAGNWSRSKFPAPKIETVENGSIR